jgi:hypothetical protein
MLLECYLCSPTGQVLISGAARRLSVGVPAIVFGYPRHSGATDEGMTNGPPIFAYLVFGPGGVLFGKPSRPIKAVAWHGPGAKLGVQARFRGVQVRLDLGRSDLYLA